MGELAKYLMCDSSNVTGITDRLEERGLVRRTVSDQDRRVKLLVLTDEGESLRKEITERLAEPPPWLSSLPERDQLKLKEILEHAVAADQESEPMNASERIRAEVESWDEVETGPGRFGSVRFTVGRRELGHLHGDSIADLPLRPEVARELIASGNALDHRYTPPDSGWVTIELDTDEDAERVIELMRSSYERDDREALGAA